MANLPEVEPKAVENGEEKRTEGGRSGNVRNNYRRQNRGGRRPRRHQHRNRNPQYGGTARELHVSGDSPVKRVAGAIAWIAREGECPRILATQPPAINTACKAIAIARNYLRQDNIDICAYPNFSPGRRRTDDSFTFNLNKTARRREPPTNNYNKSVKQQPAQPPAPSSQQPVPQQQPAPQRPQDQPDEPQKIQEQEDSKNLQEENSTTDEDVQQMKISKNSAPPTVAGAISARVREGQRVVLACIGPDCVAIAVRSIAIARSYLSEDAVDVSFRPRFQDINFSDGRTSSSLQFSILAQQI